MTLLFKPEVVGLNLKLTFLSLSQNPAREDKEQVWHGPAVSCVQINPSWAVEYLLCSF
jgi:hypothetical protein